MGPGTGFEMIIYQELVIITICAFNDSVSFELVLGQLVSDPSKTVDLSGHQISFWIYKKLGFQSIGQNTHSAIWSRVHRI